MSSEEQIPKRNFQHEAFYIWNISAELDFLDWIASTFVVKKGQHSATISIHFRNFDSNRSLYERLSRNPRTESTFQLFSCPVPKIDFNNSSGLSENSLRFMPQWA